MRTILALLVLAFFPITIRSASRHADGDYVIVLNGNESPDVVQRQHRVGRRPKTATFHGDFLWKTNNGYHGFSAHLTGAQADDLENDTRVAVIEPDVAVTSLDPMPPTAGIEATPSNQIALTPPGWKLRQNYSARNGKVLDALSGMVPVLVGPIGTGMAGSDSTYVCFINYAAHTSSLVALTNITDSAAPNGGGVALRGTNLWVVLDTAQCFAPVSNFDTTGAWKILHYGISGSPPSTAKLLDSYTFPIIGCTSINQSQAQLYYTPAGGIVTSFYMPNAFNISSLTNRYMGLIYRTPAGAWTYQYPAATLNLADDINVEDLRTSFLAHPADNAIWGFSCEPGSDTIHATRIVESGGAYTYTVNKQWAYQGYPQQIAYETTPPGLLSDPYNQKLVLMYGSWRLAPTMTNYAIYEPATIVDVAANGTYTYIQNTNIYIGSLQTGMAGIIESATRRSFVYRDMGGPFSGPVAFSEGMAGTNVPLTSVSVQNGVWGAPIPFVDQADIHISYIQNAPGILYTHWPDHTVYLAYSVATTPPLTQQIPTGVRRIGCLSNALWQASSTTPIGVDVAIIDTGIQLNHPDLNVYTNVTFVNGTTTGDDDNGHGTHVAGIVGAKNNTIGSVGVAPGARLWAVKALDSAGSGTLSTIISGVDWVIQHAAQIEVVNMSLGGNGSSESLRLAIQNSVAAGVVYVVAADNSGADVYGGDWIFGTDDDFFPASYPEVATVTAINDTDGIAGGLGTPTQYGNDDALAQYSNYGHSVVAGNPVFSPGASIDVAAPGTQIYSTSTNSSYATLTGTSMASPHVAGAAALYIAANGRANNSTNVYAIRQALINAATPQTSWGVNDTNPWQPNNDHNPEGLVNARTAPVVGASPVVAISAPTVGFSTTSTNVITFTGTATDAEDGNIAANLIWNSSIMGQIGTGATFSRTLMLGQHVITAHVTDSAGNLGYASVAITVNLAGNTAPTVTITSPVNGASFPNNSTVTFTGTATDTEDGSLTAVIHWYTPAGSLMGVGATSSWTFGTGTYTIKAVATDSGLLSTTNTVTIVVNGSVVVPVPPVITLLCPTNGATLDATNFPAFSCTVIDAQDGDISNSAYWWITPADCPTGWCEVRFATNTIQWYGVSQGWWTWRITATNSSSLASTNTFSYFIDRGLSNEPPVITITSPPSGSVFTNGTPIAFAQTCYDAIDGNWADEVTWTSSIDGLFINTNSVNTGAWERVVTNSSLSLGQHTIMVTAIDKGINGAPPFSTNTVMTSLTIVTYNPALPALSVTATPNKTSYRHKEKVTVTAHVTSSGTNVPNAALTFSFAYRDTRRAPHTLYATATTDSSGNGSAIFPIPASSVAGTATIPVTATKTGYQSGNATATFTILTR